MTGWIARHRRRPGTRPAQRAGTVHGQVVLVLRWLRHRLDVRLLARDAGISIATAYRYLHEGLDVIAAHAPGLHDVLDDARAAGLAFLCLDGTLMPTDRVAAGAGRSSRSRSSTPRRTRPGWHDEIQRAPGEVEIGLWRDDLHPGSPEPAPCSDVSAATSADANQAVTPDEKTGSSRSRSVVAA